MQATDWTTRATLTIEEAAAVLRLSRGTAYAAARSGRIPVLRFGRRMVVPRAALELLLRGETWPARKQVEET
jgi:excisionase family DNA binding protein